MELLTTNNPVFGTYIICASIMILKAVSMSWLTVYRMMRSNSGLRSPEDLKKTPLNKEPSSTQLELNDYVDRIRRIHLNDLENIPFFLASGFLFIFTEPSISVANFLFYAYVVTRLLHFIAYFTAQIHDIRASLWTPGSLIILYMAGSTLYWACGL